MQPNIAEERPPYVVWETRPEEDRNASLESGTYIATDVDYAIITPQGTKERIERKVSEWFEHLETQVQENRFRGDWLDHYKKGYQAWKEGREVPLVGTPITNWAVLSPSQVQMLQGLRLRTVEDVAGATEEALMRMGMGSRGLKERAINWLASASDAGKLAERVSSSELRLKEMMEANEKLQATNMKLAQELETLLAKKA